MYGISLSEALSSGLSFRTVVAGQLKVTTDAVVINNIIESNRRRSIRALLISGVSFDYTITTFDATATMMANSLALAVTSGSFITALQQAGFPDATSSTVPSFHKPTFLPTSAPVDPPDPNAQLMSNTQLIGAVVGTVAGVIGLMFTIYKFYQRCKQDGKDPKAGADDDDEEGEVDEEDNHGKEDKEEKKAKSDDKHHNKHTSA